MQLLNSIKRKSLTAKIAATSSTLTILVVVVLSVLFVVQQKNQIYAGLKSRGISLAKITAHSSAYGVLTGQNRNLSRLIRNIETEEDIAYIIIQDARGNVLAQTDTGMEREAIIVSPADGENESKNVVMNMWQPNKSSSIYDVSVSITSQVERRFDDEFNSSGIEGPNISTVDRAAGKKIGTARIGISTKNAQRAIVRSIGLAAALTIILGVASMLMTSKVMEIILDPMRSLLSCVRSTGEGDLTTEIVTIETKDEVGELSKAFSQMQESLTSMVRQIQSSAELVDASVSELSSSSRQQAAGATEQSTSLTETSSAVEELATVSKQIAENAKKVAEMAEQSLERMETIRENTTQGANRILALGEKSQSIGEVVSMIDDITRQTNLLALNASIEAARAGSAGKGFAVVATEIRKLATNVAGSTDQIREIIKEIQNATNASVLATENITNSVESGIEMSKRAAESAAHINMATQQQKSASDQMVSTIKEMVAIAQQTSSGAKQIAETANKLSDTTKEQRNLVSQFRIQ
jgi:methyl-accepting chemotaxis protein